MKKILILIFILGTVAYLVFAATVLSSKNQELICQDVELFVKDSIQGSNISKLDLINLLKAQKVYPVDRPMNLVSTIAIEKAIRTNPLIDQVYCYKTPSGRIGIDIYQRIPIIRVFDKTGKKYIVDRNGKPMPPQTKCKSNILVATGNITEEYACGPLYEFAKYIEDQEFWNNQIQQIHVNRDDAVELIPRVGEHTIYLGPLTDYDNKLERLRLFYKKVLNKIGWNKYSYINLEFSNQIICTDKHKK